MLYCSVLGRNIQLNGINDANKTISKINQYSKLKN